MTRKIKLVFHVGYGKTATTSVQNKLAELPNVLFLGKGKFKEKNFQGEIGNLHYKLFKTYRMEAIMGFGTPSRSSAALVNKIASIIVKLIENSSQNIIVLSDECIGDYFNYIGEWNIFLTIALANTIEEKLGAYGHEVEKVLTFTIRRQLDVIKSVIGYQSTLIIKSVDELVDCYSKNPDEGILGGYFYYSNIRLFERVAKKDWSIKVIPYEFLEECQKLDSYLCRILDVSSLDIDSNNQVDNSNSSVNPKSGIREQILKRRNIFSGLGFRFLVEGMSIYLNAKKRRAVVTRYFGAGLYLMGKIFAKVGGLQTRAINLCASKRTSYVTCSHHAENKITQIYLADNERLKRYVDVAELRKFGYLPASPNQKRN